MKIIITIVAIILLTCSVAFSGIVSKSDYDQVWTITITNCQGYTTVYYDCVILNDGQAWLVFMPDQGNIPSGNGKTVKINTIISCNQILMESD